MSIATATSTINVPFHGDSLYLVNFNNEPYVPMKPVVESMGMVWAAQFVKLKQRFAKGVSEIEIPSSGGNQAMTCLAFRKFAAWLQTIQPNKVKPEIRDKVIQYQEECDDVLYEYWTKGQVSNPRKAKKALPGKITPEQQEAIKQLVLSRGRSLPQDKQAKAIITLWSSLKSHFGCSYKEINEEQFTEALSLAARVPIEGEYLGKDDQQNALSPLSYQVLCRVENGKQVKIKMFGLDKTVDDVDSWQIWMKHKGAVFLFSDKQKREFVRDQVNRYLN
ncbi:MULTISPECIES: phage antirepressor N-terminal domain-containing protein [unclassified Erwinia]|uniref:phage antirepressor N-terminal domain-containing protein n=1 Tax=unclassified Erwinia TaxID=2622719 RepID=UPI001F534A92|nr:MULTISPECIES: phage antirepressor N-terminal domain-containing protein [unclassified Erwinia]